MATLLTASLHILATIGLVALYLSARLVYLLYGGSVETRRKRRRTEFIETLCRYRAVSDDESTWNLLAGTLLLLAANSEIGTKVVSVNLPKGPGTQDNVQIGIVGVTICDPDDACEHGVHRGDRCEPCSRDLMRPCIDY